MSSLLQGGTYYDYVSPGDVEAFSPSCSAVDQAFIGPPNGCHWRPHGPGAGVEITLPSAVTIDTLRYVSEQEPGHLGEEVDVYTSADGSAWTAVGTYPWTAVGIPVGGWDHDSSNVNGAAETAIPATTSARWRLVLSNSLPRVAQLEGFATGVYADFTGTPLSGPAPLSVAFTDLSAGSPTSWAWDFGDGGSSAAQDPAHVYASPGVYTVSLTATGPDGSGTVVKAAYVTVLTRGISLD